MDETKASTAAGAVKNSSRREFSKDNTGSTNAIRVHDGDDTTSAVDATSGGYTGRLMSELRRKLDDRGIPWEDASTHHNDRKGVFHMDRTRFTTPDGDLISVIWGYTARRGKDGRLITHGGTFGWPNHLECMPFSTTSPKAMTVQEILAEYAGWGGGHA